MDDDVTDGCIIVVNDEGIARTPGYSKPVGCTLCKFLNCNTHTHTHTHICIIYAISISTQGFTINFPNSRNERFNFAGLSKLILVNSEINFQF